MERLTCVLVVIQRFSFCSPLRCVFHTDCIVFSYDWGVTCIRGKFSSIHESTRVCSPGRTSTGSLAFSTIGHDFDFSHNYSLFLTQRQIVQLSRHLVKVNFNPLIAVVTVSHLWYTSPCMHVTTQCQTRVNPVGGSHRGTDAGWLKYTWNESSILSQQIYERYMCHIDVILML